MSLKAGQELRKLRERLRLTLRQVETASSTLADKYGNSEFYVPISRLSEIENHGTLPTIFRIYSLSAIYGNDYREVCAWYGVDWSLLPADIGVGQCPRTRPFNALDGTASVNVPVTADVGFDPRRTTNILRMIQKWGAVPAAFLRRLADLPYSYALVGTEDLTMYPIILPGSLLQIDESKTKVLSTGWRSEYERPIYFIETRNEFICSWCSIDERAQLLSVQPHPLSPVTPRTFRNPQDAEVIGQVVGIATKLDGCKLDASTQQTELTARLSLTSGH